MARVVGTASVLNHGQALQEQGRAPCPSGPPVAPRARARAFSRSPSHTGPRRTRPQKDGKPKPQSGNSRQPNGLQSIAIPKGSKKAKAQQRAMLAAQLDGGGGGFSKVYGASQKKKAGKSKFAY